MKTFSEKTQALRTAQAAADAAREAARPPAVAFRYISKCRCGERTSVLATNARKHGKIEGFPLTEIYTEDNGTELPMMNGWLMIPCKACGKQSEGKRVVGRVRPSIKCASKCQGSHGTACDCACGGKNHGSGFGK